MAYFALIPLSTMAFLLLGLSLFGAAIPHRLCLATVTWAGVSGLLGGLAAQVFARTRVDFTGED